MTNFRLTGSGLVLRWLDAFPTTLLHSCSSSYPNTSTNEMEGDDPWDWSIERVVRELCTPTRSWQPRTASMLIPDPAALERVLREHEVNGNVLLIDVDDNVMRQDFGLKVLGRRAFIRGAIEDLRAMSAKYQLHARSHFNPSLAPSQYIPSLGAIAPTILQHGYDLISPVPQPMNVQLGLQSSFSGQTPAAGAPRALQNSESPLGRSMSSDATGSKRRKLDNDEANDMELE